MYHFVAQLKNQQIEIEHGCFLPIGRRPHNFSKLPLLKYKTRYFGADPPAK